MTKMEKVKKGMECCTSDVHDPYVCRECPYLGLKVTRDGCIQPMLLDALAIFREYEPVRHGRWVSKEGIYGVVYCSICDFELKIDNTPRCPKCGAKMDKEADNE